MRSTNRGFFGLLLVAGLLLDLLATGSARADWPEFRGPTGQGIATAEGLPASWSPTENVRWRSDVPGAGWSSPVIAGGRLYLSTAVALDAKGRQSLRALAYRTSDGGSIWETTVFEQEPSRIHAKNSHASATPLVSGERLYVHYGTYGTACLDVADGSAIWQTRDLVYQPVHGNGGSPALAGDLLIINCDGGDRQFVVALDCTTGKERWRAKRPGNSGRGFSFSTPLVIETENATRIVSPGSDWVVAYDLDGAEVWRAGYPGGYSVVPRPVYGAGLLFVSSGYDAPVLLAVRPGGKGDVTRTHVAWRAHRGAPHNPSPLYHEDRLYVVGDRGIATCLDARSGEQLWQNRLGGSFSASPVLADGKIYFLDEAGTCTVIAAGARYEVLGKSALGERTLASPAVDGDAIYIRTEKRLYAIAEVDDAKRGER